MGPVVHVRRMVSAVVAFVLVTGVLVGVAGAASGASYATFDPGYLITDTVFYDAGAMSAAQVQTFLDDKGASCRPAADGTACLKDYRQTTSDRAATDRCRAAYVGAADERASTIIAKVAQACGINPRVILVTLQKEQSLVTRTIAGADTTYRKAMGYGCPDTSACDTRYYGFFNQVYSAASQLRNYALNPQNYKHKAGQTNAIAFHPYTVCGSSQVFIRNQATASLYNYTPYQPNGPALAAGYGAAAGRDGQYTGPQDPDCASYGNRNFWAYFTDWFGSTISANPVGYLDLAVGTGGDSVRFAGWALDPDINAPVSVHLYIDGKYAATTSAGTSRPDVGAAYPGWGDQHGFDATVVTTQGTHRVCAYAINQLAGDRNIELGCATANVVNHAPIGYLDQVSATASTITVKGWAYDQDKADGTPVHVYIGSQLVARGVADTPRPDVGTAIRGAGNNRGYEIEFPVAAGTHRVCTFAIDRPAGVNPLLGCQTVTVVNALPIGYLDVAKGGAGSVSVQGWVWDSDAPSPSAVHVYVDGAYAGRTTADAPRPDVAAAVPGASGTTGYAVTVPASPGTHQVCVYAINGPAGVNPQIACAAGVTVS